MKTMRPWLAVAVYLFWAAGGIVLAVVWLALTLAVLATAPVWLPWMLATRHRAARGGDAAGIQPDSR